MSQLEDTQVEDAALGEGIGKDLKIFPLFATSTNVRHGAGGCIAAGTAVTTGNVGLEPKVAKQRVCGRSGSQVEPRPVAAKRGRPTGCFVDVLDTLVKESPAEFE